MSILSVEHFPQEHEAACLAACSQMVLHALGIQKRQYDLNQLFQLTPFGVPFSRIMRLEQFGVTVSIHTFASEMALIEAIDRAVAPIAFLRTDPLPYWKAETQHAVVVVGYESNRFWVNDPAFAEAPQLVFTEDFLLAWDGMDYAYALVRLK